MDLCNRVTPASVGEVYDDGVRGYLASEIRMNGLRRTLLALHGLS